MSRLSFTISVLIRLVMYFQHVTMNHTSFRVSVGKANFASNYET